MSQILEQGGGSMFGVWYERTLTRNVTDQIPAFDEVWFFALQPDNTLISPLLKLLVFIEALLRLLRQKR